MTPTGGFALHPEAAQDITDIWEYIANENPVTAGRVRQDILLAIRNLVSFPQAGHRRPDLTARPLRFTRVRDYLIAYAPDEQPLWVIAVLHGLWKLLDCQRFVFYPRAEGAERWYELGVRPTLERFFAAVPALKKAGTSPTGFEPVFWP